LLNERKEVGSGSYRRREEPFWASAMKPTVIASPNEQKIADSQSTVRAYSGFKTAAISGAIVAVPTLVGCRVIPWAKANLNYTAQALIISAGIIFLSTLALLK
ncbi:hypothetical protein GW17_00035502, partial [Ensete ventricosum]